MTFQANIPLATDLISVSQNDLKNNFGSVSTAFNVNHVDFNAAGAGKHKFVTMPEQGGAPGTVGNEMAMYTKKDGSNVNQLFLQRQTNGTEIQLTPPVLGDPVNGNPGTSFLPGGLIVKWGTGSGSGNGSVTFASLGLTDFPNSCFMVFAQPVNGGAPTSDGGYVYTSSPTTSQFSFLSVRRTTLAATSVTFYFFAIGN